jgi:hypothetical protein
VVQAAPAIATGATPAPGACGVHLFNLAANRPDRGGGPSLCTPRVEALVTAVLPLGLENESESSIDAALSS